MKKLYRSNENKVWKGILGGMGEYFGVDPVLVRVFFILFLFMSGILPGVLAYIVLIFIVPKRPKTVDAKPID